MGKGKLFKAAATIAAIGGVCYVFRDKIKNSTVYQSLDMDDKVEKVKNTIKEKMPAKEEPERNYFSLDDAPVEGTIDQQSENTSDISADKQNIPLKKQPLLQKKLKARFFMKMKAYPMYQRISM